MLRIISALLMSAGLNLSNAKDLHLRIGLSGADSGPPTVMMNGKSTPPQLVLGEDRWVVPLGASDSFITIYKISSTNNLIQPLRLEVPSSLLTTDESVYLLPPVVSNVDEPHVKALWSDNSITARPSDIRVQFEYLQTLLYINKKIQQDPAQDQVISSSTNASASLMLLQVVANLAEKTWFVADSASQTTIDRAVTSLKASANSNHNCKWLGSSACRSISTVLTIVENALPKRGSRMIDAILPRDSIDRYFCSKEKITQLAYFWDYAAGIPDNLGGFSKSKIAVEIIDCRMTYSLCAEIDPSSRILNLQEAEDMLVALPSSDAQLSSRRKMIRATLGELKQGHPAVCPDRG